MEAGHDRAPLARKVKALKTGAGLRRLRLVGLGAEPGGTAKKPELSQVWVSRIEAGGGYGSRETRRKLAAALEAPVWALEEEVGQGSVSPTWLGTAGRVIGRPVAKSISMS